MIARVFPPAEVASAPVRIALPLSKSLSNRRLMLDALAGVDTPVSDVARCDDTDVMRRALRGGCTDGRRIDIGACGTAMRFLTALYACRPGAHVVLTGTERMRARPVGPLVDSLRSLGADVEYVATEGCPPLRIRGRHLAGGEVAVDASVSSQYVSALMMVAPLMERGLTITLQRPVASLPYIHATAGMLGLYGVNVEFGDNAAGEPTVSVPHAELTAGPVRHVEEDWSAASYWY